MKNTESRQADVGHRVACARARPPVPTACRASETESEISPRENPATVKMRTAGSTESVLDKL
jgi:hypothetical protein